MWFIDSSDMGLLLIWPSHINLMDRPHSSLTQIRHLTMIISASIIHLSTCMAASDSKVAVWIKNNMKYFLKLWCSIWHSEIRVKYFIKHKHALRHWHKTNIYLTDDTLKTCAWGTATITLHKTLEISICKNCIQFSYGKHWKRKMVLWVS